MKHTPGPWRKAPNGKNKETFRIWRTDPNQPEGDEFRNAGYALITTHVHGVANANLIAAAPELYTALETLLADYAQDGTFRASVHNAVVALAKARGEA